jgi:hypothetical protein
MLNTPRPTPARRQLIPLAGAVSFLLAGCSGEDSAAEALASGRLDGPDFELRPSAEAVYTVGAFDGEDWETFADVTAVAFDAIGRLFILDAEAKRITVLDPDGTLITAFGKEGEGPGELLQPFGFAVQPGGEVTLFDFGQRGFQRYSAEGEFLGSTVVDPEEGMPGQTLLPTADGELLTTGGMRFSVGSGGAVSMQTEEGRPISAFSPADGSQRLAYDAWRAPPPEGESSANLESGRNRMQLTMRAMRAFEPGLHFAPLSDGRLAVVDSIGYRVKLVARDGAVVEILERPIPPTPVTEEIREKERENRLAALESGGARLRVIGSSGGMSIDQATISSMMQERIEAMEFANEIPAIASMSVDWEDRIWIERSAPVPGEDGPTDVITSDGRYLGTIPPDGLRIPDAFGPTGLLAYIETDELDVERVRVVRLAGPELTETRD